MHGHFRKGIDRFNRIGIRIKTLLVLLLATVLGVLSTSAVYYYFSQQVARKAALEHLETAAENQAKRVILLREQYIKRLNLLANGTQLHYYLQRMLAEGPVSTARRTIGVMLNDALAADPEFKAIYVIVPNGRVVASTRRAHFVHGSSCSGECRQEAHPSVQVRTNGNQPILEISGSIKHKGHILGTLIVDASVEDLKNITADYTGLGETGETIVAAPNQKGGYFSLTPLRHSNGEFFSPLTIKPSKSPGKPMVYDFLDYRGKWVLAAKVDIPRSDWITFVKRDQDEIFQRAKYLKQLMVYLITAASIVSICLGLLFSSTLTRSLLRIVYTTRRIANGDLHLRIIESRKDEIGDLARSVNEMADRLVQMNLSLEEKVRERTEELSDLNQQLEKVNSELNRMVRHDPLTGLLNRRVFDETFDTEWKRAQRNGTYLGLILVDIDHFKQFNDCGGHDAGDGCLRTVSNILSGQTRRSGDVLTRYGGEELAIIMPGSDIADVASFAEKLREAVFSTRIPHSAPECDYVTVSLGAASLMPRNGLSADDLFKRADNALYAAKNRGRNRVETFREPEFKSCRNSTT